MPSTSPARRWRITAGDALTVLARLPAQSVDAVVTDPPYSSFWTSSAGTGSRYLTSTSWAAKNHVRTAGASCPDFAGEDRDPRAWLKWCSLWLAECFRLARDGSPCVICSDWRQIPNVADALRVAGWKYRGVLVWDKTRCCRPIKGWFANQCEFLVAGVKGKPARNGPDAPYPGSYFRQMPPRQRLHQVQKPIELMRWALQVVRPGGHVLDPFCGSATTGVAALELGMRFTGIEMVDAYAAIARQRLRHAVTGRGTAAPVKRAA